MRGKFFILNADDLGMSKLQNSVVFDGHKNGFLNSASLCANGPEFNDAVENIILRCPELGIGIHLNIVEGMPLEKNLSLLTDKKGFFNKNFFQIMQNSADKMFLLEVEYEFRAQIEKALKKMKVDHLDSHMHIHAIPNIFIIAAKLAKEYDIPYIRSQYEKMYFTLELNKYLNVRYFLNILKVILLKYFTAQNKKVVKEMSLKTNDYLIGVGYSGLMSANTVARGIKSIKENCVVEALIHPAVSGTENQIAKNRILNDKIAELGFQITNYGKLYDFWN